MVIALIALVVALLVLLAYWELVLAEGVHLGPRVVVLLYDLVARRYNRIKQFDPLYEAWFLSDPLLQALHDAPASSDEDLRPLVLDVATGTGRLPKALLTQKGFRGCVIGLDRSRRMLAQAARDTRDLADRLMLLWRDAGHLPFSDDLFDAVTCIEALEFMPDTRQALREIIRVLRPGGVLLVTNRAGPWAKFLPGHTQTPQAFEALLTLLGLQNVQTQTWQAEYDLVWARKPGSRIKSGTVHSGRWRCIHCNGPLTCNDHSFVCSTCGRAYLVAPDGVIEMMR